MPVLDPRQRPLDVDARTVDLGERELAHSSRGSDLRDVQLRQIDCRLATGSRRDQCLPSNQLVDGGGDECLIDRQQLPGKLQQSVPGQKHVSLIGCLPEDEQETGLRALW